MKGWGKSGTDNRLEEAVKGELRVLAIALLIALFPSLISAQGMSGNRPMRIIVPVAPGGPSDTAVRIILPKLSEALGQTLVVDNRPSANGVAGTDIAAKAAPDGSTFRSGTDCLPPLKRRSA